MADDMKYCPHCGAKHGPDADFCPKCGKRLTEEKYVRKFNLGPKLKKILIILTFMAWVISSSLIISSISINHTDYDCGRLLYEPNCEARSVAEISIANSGNLAVLPISLVATYILYKLWFKRKPVSSLRFVLAVLATFIAVFYSVGFAFAGEQKNDRQLLTLDEKRCVKARGLDYIIENGTYNCGPNVDNLMNTSFSDLAPDRNDSNGTVAMVWLLYLTFISGVVILPKKGNRRSAYHLKR